MPRFSLLVLPALLVTCAAPAVAQPVTRTNASVVNPQVRVQRAATVTPETTTRTVRVPASAITAVTAESTARLRGATAAAAAAATTTPPVATPPRATPAAQDTVTRVNVKAGAVRIDRRALEVALGSARDTIRVVRNGVPVTVRATETAVSLTPGDFVFRKMGAIAVRVPPATRAPAPTPTPTPGPTTTPPVSATPSGTPDTGTTTAPTPAPRPARASVRFAMPYRWFTIDSSGVQRVLVPFVELMGGGMTYDVARRTYLGQALVGVEDTLHPDAGSVPLPTSLKLQLRTMSGGTVTPITLEIRNTGLDYVPVRVEAPDSTSLRVRTGADPVGIIVPLPRRVLQVGITPSDSLIAGFGLSTTTLVLSLPPGVERTDTAHVGLTGGATPETLALTAAGATVHLRSRMPGDSSVVRVMLDNIEVGRATVRYSFPWQFLGASLLGIVLAGVARFFGARKRKPTTRLGRDIATGAVPGLLIGCGAAIGLDVLGLKVTDPTSFAAVMVTTALGAWGGTRLLDSLSTVPEAPAAG